MKLKRIGSVLMGVLSGNPQNEPLHYGEVFAVWGYLSVTKGNIAGYQVLSNHTGDEDLKKLLEDSIQDMKREEEKLEEILKVNGIALPPAPPERPYATIESIPAGARINDPEVSAKVSADIAAGLIACSQAIGQSVREDIAMMFGQFHMTKAQYGAKLLRLNKEKGWLIPPPLHVGTPEDC
ncbi:DUF3231 family protein [Bacillus carboniphilus]|uniref:DUF3231 family protein n=2 Tax=Bacillus carboniphilus TaxID=86663 RepID=A0ABP3GBC3_9BACI